jgi:cytochrome P450
MKSTGLDKLMEKVSPKYVLGYYDFIDANVERKKEKRRNSSEVFYCRERSERYLSLFFQRQGWRRQPAYSTDELNSEALLLIIAVSDTTATSLIGFWHYIVRDQCVNDKLVKEFRSTFKSADGHTPILHVFARMH